ncbi:DJ-1/PfpI family protein [Echinimonas agarilytica]|uniref:DJ-1/PfpI family protein n=1 Tax=Echinimonas agarilytica TaxID=1215918 RepID=A0AA42B6J6_9GAMM|nr:DJ-1/PfpI family protein [Echinimonas agarilytica]
MPGTSVEQAQTVLLQDDVYMSFLQRVCGELAAKPHQCWPRYASVCAGALLLANTGIFKGKQVTTHWAMRGALANLQGVTLAPDYPRYVHDQDVLTGGGIASGIDEALYLVSSLSSVDEACKAQLIMQYAPAPPFHCGNPDQAEQSGYLDMVNGMLSADQASVDTIQSILQGRYGSA